MSSPKSDSISKPQGNHFRQPLLPGKMLPGKRCFSDPQNEEVLPNIQPQSLQPLPRPTSSLSFWRWKLLTTPLGEEQSLAFEAPSLTGLRLQPSRSAKFIPLRQRPLPCPTPVPLWSLESDKPRFKSRVPHWLAL